MKTLKYLITAAVSISAVTVFAGNPIILTDRIDALDASLSQTSSEDNGWVSATLAETNGVISQISVSLDGTKYDAAGAASQVATTLIGDSSDTGEANTIHGAKAYADSVAAAQDITIAEGSANGTISVTKGSGAAQDIPVHGLGSAAYTASTAYDATGTAAAAVAALDTASDVTTASVSDGVVTLTAGIAETDGVITKGSGTDITLVKVATTGAAGDVSYDNTDTGLEATTVQAAIDEIVTEKASDIDARIILAITNGITVNGVTYKLVVDPAE